MTTVALLMQVCPALCTLIQVMGLLRDLKASEEKVCPSGTCISPGWSCWRDVISFDSILFTALENHGVENHCKMRHNCCHL